MALTAIEKAEKAEAKALTILELRNNRARTSLQGQGEQGALLSERVAETLLNNLEAAVNAYKLSVTTILAVAGDDEEKKNFFLEKLSVRMNEVNPVLDKLHTNVSNLKLASNPPVAVMDQTSKLRTKIQIKVRLIQKTIQSCLNLI